MESSEREVQTAQQWSEYGPSTMTEGELLLNTRGTGFKESIFGSLFSDLHTNPKIWRVKSKDLIQNPASTAALVEVPAQLSTTELATWAGTLAPVKGCLATHEAALNHTSKPGRLTAKCTNELTPAQISLIQYNVICGTAHYVKRDELSHHSKAVPAEAAGGSCSSPVPSDDMQQLGVTTETPPLLSAGIQDLILEAKPTTAEKKQRGGSCTTLQGDSSQSGKGQPTAGTLGPYLCDSLLGLPAASARGTVNDISKAHFSFCLHSFSASLLSLQLQQHPYTPAVKLTRFASSMNF
ncbi:hypothetical protein Anapl_07870 [Anas platyrhynchos]|uniref:Uncharacterized protein n=1 Tax=Anas platyrhynchos TaxID=8839 RepID=R0K4K9_ANAPL|nr:hypothetical protein Anapl_07870 [Anas platyrhynchos]